MPVNFYHLHCWKYESICLKTSCNNYAIIKIQSDIDTRPIFNFFKAKLCIKTTLQFLIFIYLNNSSILLMINPQIILILSCPINRCTAGIYYQITTKSAKYENIILFRILFLKRATFLFAIFSSYKYHFIVHCSILLLGFNQTVQHSVWRLCCVFILLRLEIRLWSRLWLYRVILYTKRGVFVAQGQSSLLYSRFVILVGTSVFRCVIYYSFAHWLIKTYRVDLNNFFFF